MTVPTIALTPAVGAALGAAVGAADAPLLVLGPSLGTSTILWQNTLPALAARYRVMAWDLPGHGASPVATQPFTVGELADAVAAAVGELGAAEIFYAGVSLGGATGLELCLRHPQLITRAAIIASGAQLGDADAWHARAAQVRAQSTSSLVSSSAERWFAAGSIEREPELSGRLLHALREADAESYARCCEALAGYDVRDRLGAISTPLLAVWGEHDRVAPEEKSVEIAAGADGARSARIDGAAHLPPAEQPAAVARILIKFFGRGDEAS